MRDAGLLRRWSRRDWLSVAVVAVTTAFLVGTALLLLSAVSYTATLEGLSSTAVASFEENPAATAEAGESPGQIVISVAKVSVETAERPEQTWLAGIPPDSPKVVPGASVAWKSASLPQPTENTVVGPVAYRQTVAVTGNAGRAMSEARPLVNGSVFPASWYAGRPALVERVGPEGAFVIRSGAGGQATGFDAAAAVKTGDVPLVAAFPFLVAGVRQLLGVLALTGLAGAVVVAVVVHSVTRMTVRDRRLTIRVLRSTGADPLRVGWLLTARATLVALAGVTGGVALGVAAPPLLVAGADALGLPVSLPTGLTMEKLRFVASVAALLVGAGVAGGVAAAVPAVRAPPASVDTDSVRTDNRPEREVADGESEGRESHAGRLAALRRAYPTPTLLGWQTAVPTTATLTVFVLVVLLVGGLVGALAPLTANSTGTVTEAGAAHPLNSRVSVEYADALRAQGVAASPEVIAAQVYRGEPYLARGANFTAFARVSGAELSKGRIPDRADEAAIGADLARTLDVSLGETITVSGSVSPHLARVEVVGVYNAPGAVDDQLVVPIETVAPSATGSVDQVHLIRAGPGAADALADGSKSALIVTRLSAPDTVLVGESATVTVHVRNLGGEQGDCKLTVEVGGETLTRRVTVDAGGSTTVTVERRWNATGERRVVAGPFERTVRVTDGRSLTLPPEFPRRAPPGATLLVPVTTENGTRFPSGSVQFGGRAVPVSTDGVATVPLPDEPGSYPLSVSAPGHTGVNATVTVTPEATREIGARIVVEPPTGTTATRPNVTVLVANPWGRTMRRNLTLLTPGGAERRTVELRPGNVSRVRVDAATAGFDGHVAPGTYTLRLLVDGELAATTRYEATGTAAGDGAGVGEFTGTYSGGTGLGTAITRVFGNVQVLFAGTVVLAGLATASGTAATFARAVHARRRSIGVRRATGGSPRAIVGLLVRDAVVLAVPASTAAVIAAAALATLAARADLLVAFGIRLDPSVAGSVVVVAAIGSVALAVGGVLVAAVPVLLTPPARLVEDES